MGGDFSFAASPKFIHCSGGLLILYFGISLVNPLEITLRVLCFSPGTMTNTHIILQIDNEKEMAVGVTSTHILCSPPSEPSELP